MAVPGTSVPSLLAAPELDQLDAKGFADALAPLFEGAPRFVARLAAGRPYGTYTKLLDAARETALTMPEDEQLELIDAHPRIGAPPGSVSALSFVEQGYDRERGDAAAEVERERIAADLAWANTAYESRFGFRFVVFVAGRQRSEILPLMVAALSAERSAEIRRALQDIVAIARDRVRKSASDGSDLASDASSPAGRRDRRASRAAAAEGGLRREDSSEASDVRGKEERR